MCKEKAKGRPMWLKGKNGDKTAQVGAGKGGFQTWNATTLHVTPPPAHPRTQRGFLEPWDLGKVFLQTALGQIPMAQGIAKQGSLELQNPGMASWPGTGMNMEKDPPQTPFLFF